MDPYEERVSKINKEIERTLFVNLALESEIKSVEERLERVRKDREILLAKVRSYEETPTKMDTMTIVATSNKQVEGGKKGINTSIKSEKPAVKKKRSNQTKKT